MRAQTRLFVMILILGASEPRVADATEGHKLWPTIEAASEPARVDMPQAAEWVRGVHSEPVQIEGEAFGVETRSDKMKHTPCDGCHDGAFKKRSAGFGEGSDALAHEHIRLAHASKAIMRCETCHDTEAFTKLKSLGGEAVSFDHAYQICGACHMGELKDWRQGAHGKRLGNWMGPRIVLSCTGCHDPHRPVFPAKRHAVTVTLPSEWNRSK